MTIALVKMTNTIPPFKADVHPDMVQDYMRGGWVVATQPIAPPPVIVIPEPVLVVAEPTRTRGRPRKG